MGDQDNDVDDVSPSSLFVDDGVDDRRFEFDPLRQQKPLELLSRRPQEEKLSSSRGLIVMSGADDDDDDGDGDDNEDDEMQPSSSPSYDGKEELVNRAKAIIVTYKDYLEAVSQEPRSGSDDDDDDDDEENEAAVVDEAVDEATEESAESAESAETTDEIEARTRPRRLHLPIHRDDFRQFHVPDERRDRNHRPSTAAFAQSAYSAVTSRARSMADRAIVATTRRRKDGTGVSDGRSRDVMSNDFDFRNYSDGRTDGRGDGWDLEGNRGKEEKKLQSYGGYRDYPNGDDGNDGDNGDANPYGSGSGSGSGSGGNNDNGFLGLKERMATSAGSKRKHCDDRDDDHDDDYHDNNHNRRHGHNRPTIQQLSRDLGMTPHTHPHLHKFYSTPPPTLEKKRRKALRCVSLLLLSVLLVLAISSAATKGFEASRRRRAPPLPDWKEEEERLNRQKWEWEEEHGMSHEMDGLEKKPPKVMDEEAAEEAIPPPPMAAMAQDMEKEKDAATGTTTGTTTTSTTSTPPPDDYDDDKLDMIFQSVSEAYRPIWYDRTTGWTGTTYAASLLFCSSVADGGTPEYAPCPYEVYCPGRAPHHRLWGGIMDNGGESWAPVLNGENEWVQVGTGNKGKQGGGGTDNDDDDNDDVGVCELYSERYGQTPEWGYTGVADEEMTRHILCCRRHPLLEDGSDGGETQQTDQVGQEEEEEEEEEVMDAENVEEEQHEGEELTAWEQQIREKHNPVWFDNQLGWQGTTHADARAFCNTVAPHGQHGATMDLCPIQAYCPNGPNDDDDASKPLYLHKEAFEGEQWAPLDSGDNAWIMVGMLNRDPSSTCRSFKELHHRDPSWGLDGSSTSLKKNILCCEPLIDASEIEDHSTADDGLPSGITDGNFSASTSDGGTANGGTPAESNPNTDMFHPYWFQWHGGSHDDAIELCREKEGYNGKQMELCPYHAYCPNGPSKSPLGGFRDDDDSGNGDDEGEQWSPVYGLENHWVLITRRGHNSVTTCLIYQQLYDALPDWGLDDSNPEMKKHVMCCTPLQ